MYCIEDLLEGFDLLNGKNWLPVHEAARCVWSRSLSAGQAVGRERRTGRGSHDNLGSAGRMGIPRERLGPSLLSPHLQATHFEMEETLESFIMELTMPLAQESARARARLL